MPIRKPYRRAIRRRKIDVNEPNLVGGWEGRPDGLAGDGVALEDLIGSTNLPLIGNCDARSGILGPYLHVPGIDNGGYLAKTIADYRIADSQGFIECWARPVDLSAGAATILSSSNISGSSPFFSVQLYTPTGEIRLIAADGVATDIVLGDDQPVAKCWQHCVWCSNDSKWNLYLNGRDQTLTATPGTNNGKWWSNISSRDNLVVGGLIRNTAGGLGVFDIASLKIGNVPLTDAEVLRRYYDGAAAIQFGTDYGVDLCGATASGFLSNSPFEVVSGTWKISTDTIDGEFCKIIECVSAGVCAVPASVFATDYDEENAHGSWRFWLYNLDRATVARVAFISDVADTSGNYNGYRFFFGSTNRAGIIKQTGGGSAACGFSDDDYISDDTWYQCDIKRSGVGVFNEYLDGTAITVTGVGGSGSNPFTDTAHQTSKYISLSFDTGVKIAYADRQGSHSIIKRVGAVPPGVGY